MDIAIVGGGIGGLAAAVATTRAGFDVHVYEQAPAYSDIGGHLTMDDPTIELLLDWGLGEEFEAIACTLDGMEIRSLRTGEVHSRFQHKDIGTLGVKDPKRLGNRVIHAFQRADLLDLFLKRLPADRIHTGHKLAALENRDGKAFAQFENGTEIEATIIIGADGVRSRARAMLDDSGAVSADWSILRTLCPADVLPDNIPNDRMRFWEGSEFGNPETGEATHVLTVPVRDNEFISIDLQFIGGDRLEDCDPTDLPIDRVMKRYPDDCDPLVKKMIEARIEPITSHALFDRPVAERWFDGQIVILGDAAHSMRPSMGQGACQSIRDAHFLTQCFTEHGLTREALEAYEAERKPYVKMIVEVTKQQGPAPKLTDT